MNILEYLLEKKRVLERTDTGVKKLCEKLNDHFEVQYGGKVSCENIHICNNQEYSEFGLRYVYFSYGVFILLRDNEDNRLILRLVNDEAFDILYTKYFAIPPTIIVDDIKDWVATSNTSFL